MVRLIANLCSLIETNKYYIHFFSDIILSDYHFDDNFYFLQTIKTVLTKSITMTTINSNLTIRLNVNAGNMIFYSNNQMSPYCKCITV